MSYLVHVNDNNNNDDYDNNDDDYTAGQKCVVKSFIAQPS